MAIPASDGRPAMLKNHCVYLGLLCTLVACSSADQGSSSAGTGGVGAAGIGGTPGAAATFGAGGTNGVPPGTGGTLAGAAGGLSTGSTSAIGGAGALGGSGAVGGTGAAGGGGVTATTGGAPGTGTGGNGAATGGASAGGAGGTPPPVCTAAASEPADFMPNTTAGGGGTVVKDSPRFRIYGTAPAATADTTLNHLEAAYSCFIDDWCFRSTGLVVQKDGGPYYKTNIYATGSLGSAAGLTQLDFTAGLPYVQVISSQMAMPRVTVHEWGHAFTISEYNWVDQKRTGAWWETVANWVADTYMTSAYCAPARSKYGVAEGSTLIDLSKVIGQSYMLIVSTQNYYEAWPFLTYLTMNPDHYAGLGKLAVQDLMRKHTRMNETPLHVLDTMVSPVKAQAVIGRYWAHMAYLDIGHPKAQAAFFSSRATLNFANLDSMGNQTYKVKAARQPQYGGSNIIPLSGTGAVSVQVKNLGNGLPESNFTATLSIRASDGTVRYVDLPGGMGQATIASGEEASLVVANTPDMLYQYDAFATTAASPESIGLNYQVQITGAAPAN